MMRMRMFFAFMAVVATSLLIAWFFLTREENISGDELKRLVLESDRRSYSSWYLYLEDDQKYCLKYSRPVVPIRYCVSKMEIEIRNSKDSKSSKVGYIGMKDFVLKKNGQPDFPEDRF